MVSEVITKEFIQSIIVRHVAECAPHHELSGRIADELHRAGRVAVDLATLARERKAELDRHALAMAGLADREAAARGECRHPRVNWHGDPAGGNGGFRECELCGATL